MTVYEGIPAYISERKYLPLFRLNLLYIEGLDLHTLFKVLEDEPEALGAFRNYLTQTLDEFDAAAGTEDVAGFLGRIQREIDEGVRVANLNYKGAKVVSALKDTPAIIAGWTLLIYGFFYELQA